MHYSSFYADKEYILIPSGESSKSLEAILPVYRSLVNMGVDRNCFFVGMGGGVVTDIAGFVASTFMRGSSFGFISTSLLGQVDAVIGGKNGVNLDGYKNLIGTINQPDFIINDPAFFQTLPGKEYINGTAEVIKQFLVADEASFHWMNKQLDAYLQKDASMLFDLIYRQSKIKAEIVSHDEKEKGNRKILNFGHTIGHALERETGLAHGFAVSIGMVYAARISARYGLLDPDQLKSIIDMLQKCHLPVESDFELPLLLETIKKDKKRKGDSLDFILLEKIGEARIRNIDFDELEVLLNKF
jgi:3-dehydroquinate synthase